MANARKGQSDDAEALLLFVRLYSYFFFIVRDSAGERTEFKRI